MNNPNGNNHQLSEETKTKIITMRSHSMATLAQIAVECGCSVNKYKVKFCGCK